MLSVSLYRSPDFTVKVMGQDVYIKGGEYKQTYWRKDGSKREDDVFCGIAFYDDGTAIKQCCSSNPTKAKVTCISPKTIDMT